VALLEKLNCVTPAIPNAGATVMLVIVGGRFGCGWGVGAWLGAVGEPLPPQAARIMVRMNASAPLIFDTIWVSPSVFPTLVQGQFGRTDRRR
jgi:hypothetical protein